MYSNESSLYTVSDETFKYIHTGISYVVSEVGVDTIDEISETITNNALLRRKLI